MLKFVVATFSDVPRSKVLTETAWGHLRFFSRACNATYCIVSARKMLLVVPGFKNGSITGALPAVLKIHRTLTRNICGVARFYHSYKAKGRLDRSICSKGTLLKTKKMHEVIF